MALTQCQECGKRISDTASKCPNCGANRLQAVGTTSVQKAAGVGAILVGGAVLLIAASQGEELGIVLKLACYAFMGLGGATLFARSRKN
jgi:hypothetical protein